MSTMKYPQVHILRIWRLSIDKAVLVLFYIFSIFLQTPYLNLFFQHYCFQTMIRPGLDRLVVAEGCHPSIMGPRRGPLRKERQGRREGGAQ